MVPYNMKPLLTVLASLAAFAAFAAIFTLVGLLFAFPVLWLWNACLPALGIPPLDGVVHAWGINVLCCILFKSNKAKNK